MKKNDHKIRTIIQKGRNKFAPRREPCLPLYNG